MNRYHYHYSSSGVTDGPTMVLLFIVGAVLSGYLFWRWMTETSERKQSAGGTTISVHQRPRLSLRDRFGFVYYLIMAPLGGGGLTAATNGWALVFIVGCLLFSLRPNKQKIVVTHEETTDTGHVVLQQEVPLAGNKHIADRIK